MKVPALFPLKHGLTLLALFTCSLLGAQQATLSIQGVITKGDGTAVDDGSYSLIFRLWKTPNGNLPADKVHEETLVVETTGGVYSTVLGETTSLTAPFDQVYFLGVTLGSAELLPRPQLTSAPYALSLLGQSNVFPSTGPVRADVFRAKASAPGGDPAVNGYSFQSPGDQDGGLFSASDGAVSLYANGAARIELQSSPTPQTVVNGPLVTNDHTVNGNETVNGNSLVTGTSRAQKFFAPLNGGLTVGNSPDEIITVSGATSQQNFPAFPPVFPNPYTLFDTALVFKIRNQEYLRMAKIFSTSGNLTSSFCSIDGGTLFINSDNVYVDALPSFNGSDVQWNSSSKQLGVDNSSRRFKYNIRPLKDDFSLILKAQPKVYTRAAAEENWELGYIAEEMDSLGLKILVDYDEQGRPNGFNYRKMVLYVTEVVKVQQTDIEQLRAENAALKAENAALRAKQDASAQLLENVAERLKVLEARAGLNGSK